MSINTLDKRGPKGTRFIDITGKTFGRWKVVKLLGFVRQSANSTRGVWQCRCECGTVRNMNGRILRIGRSKSCGCLKDRGHRKHELYGTWDHFRHRRVSRWNLFENFVADVGGRRKAKYLGPTDPAKPIGPKNFSWTNKRLPTPGFPGRTITHAGLTLSIAEWAKKLGITPEMIYFRMKTMTPSKAVSYARLGNYGRPRKAPSSTTSALPVLG